MSDIAEKDKVIFNLNKQLSNMQILMQSSEILHQGEDNYTETNYTQINNNLSQLHNLAIQQSQHALT